ncbi:MAG: terpene cyclase/mutase family protein, partial [Planctomycetaceae bacterium]|nr:terpene cyclase/mutase family protein [Planctomycetaceae bacterium]
MMKQTGIWLSAIAVTCMINLTVHAGPRYGPDAAQLKKVRSAGMQYLEAHQNADGSWSKPEILGITALATTALLENGYSPEHPAVQKALNYLLQFKQENGGIYHPETRHRNYETSIILMALVEANRDGKYDQLIS